MPPLQGFPKNPRLFLATDDLLKPTAKRTFEPFEEFYNFTAETFESFAKAEYFYGGVRDEEKKC